MDLSVCKLSQLLIPTKALFSLYGIRALQSVYQPLPGHPQQYRAWLPLGIVVFCGVCCADDTYLLFDKPSGLKSAIDIVQHYAKRYKAIFNATTTKK